MAFHDDIQSVSNAWVALSPVGKILAISLLFCSALSVASIGDHIVDFAGFIVVGIEAYRTVMWPIVFFVREGLGWDFSQVQLDLIVLCGITASSLLRAGIFSKAYQLWKEGNHEHVYGKATEGWFWLTVLAILAPAIAVLFVEPLQGLKGASKPISLTFAILVPIYLIASSWFVRYSNTAYHLRLAGSYIFALYLLVSIVAGISEGISRIT